MADIVDVVLNDISVKEPVFHPYGRNDKMDRSDLLLLRDAECGDWAGYLFKWKVDGVGVITAKAGDIFAVSKNNLALRNVTHWGPFPKRVYPGVIGSPKKKK